MTSAWTLAKTEGAAGSRSHHPAIKRRLHRAPFDACKTEQVRATLCRHRGAPPIQGKSFSQKNFRPFRAPMHLLSVRNPG